MGCLHDPANVQQTSSKHPAGLMEPRPYHRTLFYWSKSKQFAQITNWDDRLVKLRPNCIVLALKIAS